MKKAADMAGHKYSCPFYLPNCFHSSVYGVAKKELRSQTGIEILKQNKIWVNYLMWLAD